MIKTYYEENKNENNYEQKDNDDRFEDFEKRLQRDQSRNEKEQDLER